MMDKYLSMVMEINLLKIKKEEKDIFVQTCLQKDNIFF